MLRTQLLTVALAATLVNSSLALQVEGDQGDIIRDPLIEMIPADVVDSGVIQRLDNQIPLDLVFRDEQNQEVLLSTLFDGERPVLLTLNYSDCPQLCSLVLDSVVGTLRDVNLEPGEDFRLITLSIDPEEKAARAADTKAKYVQMYDRDGTQDAWTFLRGTEQANRSFADAVGFGYRKVVGIDTTEYAHPAALIVLTPDGRPSLYLSGINDDPATVRLALVNASGGSIGGLMDLFFTTCFRYDETKGKYAPIARRILAIGGAVFVVGFAGLLITFRVLENRRSAEDIA
jgi:protein SCO1/2